MTANQVEDRELDKIIAQIEGWKWDGSTAYSPTGSSNARRAIDPWQWLPYYSTDIRECWRVVEKLNKQDGYRFVIHSIGDSNDKYVPSYVDLSVSDRPVMLEPSVWRCVVERGDAKVARVETISPSAPRAICDAIVIACGILIS